VLNTRLAALIAMFAAISCTPYDPDLGPEPFLCGDREPRCPDGYVCVVRVGADQVCQRDDVAGDVTGDANLLCSADAASEPNETIESATPAPIAETGGTHTATAVICPATDVDHYGLNVNATGMNLRVEVSYEAAAGELVVDLLNSTGLSIRNAAHVNDDAGTLRADFDNVAQGTYYGRVKGMGALNNYQITLTVTSSPLPP
jgi:hypothetical protein